MDEDWAVLVSFLPPGWRELARHTRALKGLRKDQKSGKDAGGWMPGMNQRWFAGQVIAVKRKYGLTVDDREARALEGVLSGCASTEMVVADGQAQMAEPTPGATAPSILRCSQTPCYRLVG